MMMIRSTVAAVASAVVLVAGVAVAVVSSQGSSKAAGAKPSIAVFKSPTCGCCAKWNEHLKTAGFTVNSTDRTDMTALKDEYKVPSALRSCHTGLVGGYVVEGHVPADIVARLLSEKPAGVVGI